jgi:pimeloyl-ACP methyl ester carboxylesterase
MVEESFQPEDKFVQVGSVRLHYVDWGKNGPPLVLLHGGRITGRSWDATARGLSPFFHVIALDARGHGDSDKPSRGYTYAQRSDDFEGFLNAVGMNHSYGISHSTGAVTMAVHEIHFPGKFDRIILIEPPIRPRPRPSDSPSPTNNPRDQRRVWPNRSELDRYLTEHPRTRRWTEESRRAVVEHGVTQLKDGSVEMKWTVEAYNPEEMRQNNPKLLESAPAISIPTILIYGTNGIGTRFDVEQFNESLPNSQLIWVEGAGHNVYMEEPNIIIETAKKVFSG